MDWSDLLSLGKNILSVASGGWASVAGIVGLLFGGGIIYFLVQLKLKNIKKEQAIKDRMDKEGGQVKRLKDKLLDRFRKNKETKDKLNELLKKDD